MNRVTAMTDGALCDKVLKRRHRLKPPLSARWFGFDRYDSFPDGDADFFPFLSIPLRVGPFIPGGMLVGGIDLISWTPPSP